MSDTVLTNPVTGSPLPCFVHHEDAGGPCQRPATMRVYGLHFCEVHGEDARLGAASQEAHLAWVFFERFRNETVQGLGDAIDREIRATQERILKNGPSGDEQTRAMLRAFPDATELVRQYVRQDSAEEPGLPTFYDDLMDSIYMLHECMRIACDAGATWLVEQLEMERESLSAQAAEALRERQKARG